LYPFKKMIAAGVDAIMTAHIKVPAYENVPATLSKKIMTDLLRKELEFKGLLVTDALGMGALSDGKEPGQLELEALLAGSDLILCPLNVPQAVELIEQAVRSGELSEQELDRRVLKILCAKQRVGLHKQRFVDFDNVQKLVDTPHARALKKKLYESALTCVADKKRTFPLLPQATKTGVCLLQVGVQDTLFSQMVSKQYKSPVVVWPKSTTQSDIDECMQRCAQTKTVVVELSGMHKWVKGNFGIPEVLPAELLKLQQAGKAVVLVIFGSPYSVSLFKKLDAILCAHEDDVDAKSAAARAICGELVPRGKMPVSVEMA